MVRKPNYDFDKRRKEMERKAKKDAKRTDRQQRRDERQADDVPAVEPSAPSDDQPGSVPPID